MQLSSSEANTLHGAIPALPKHHWALRHLPPFPEAATRLLRLLNNPHAGFSEFAKVIESDPSFAWEVLKAANSPLLGVAGEVGDIRHAVALMGVERVKGLVMMIALSREFRHAFREPKLVDCFKHCLAVAHLSASFSSQYGTDPGVAYTTGLLHDVGRIALMTAFPRKYAALIEESMSRKVDIRELERQFFEIDHCTAGATMMLVWKLPSELVEVCLRHHETLPEDERSLLANITFANQVAHAAGFQPVYEDGPAGLDRNADASAPCPLPQSRETLHEVINAYCMTL